MCLYWGDPPTRGWASWRGRQVTTLTTTRPNNGFSQLVVLTMPTVPLVAAAQHTLHPHNIFTLTPTTTTTPAANPALALSLPPKAPQRATCSRWESE